MVVVTLMVAVVVVVGCRVVAEVSDAVDEAALVVITHAHFNASFRLCLISL